MNNSRARFTDVELGKQYLPTCYGYIASDLMPLEQAMLGMDYILPEISRYVALAKKHCTYPNDNDLDKNESAAIYLYSMEMLDNTSVYHMLNSTLRNENREAMRSWFRYLRLFDSAASKLPKFNGTVWRGIDKDVNHLYGMGQKITWWGISSCSKSKERIKSLLRKPNQSTLFKIECSNGKSIGRYTSDRDRSEVILMPGTTFQVVSEPARDSQNYSIINLKEIAEDVGPVRRRFGHEIVAADDSSSDSSADEIDEKNLSKQKISQFDK